MSKRLSTPKNLAKWASKRAGNLDRMLEEAKTDDSRLFSYSSTMLDALATALTTVGDDAGSLYVASLARLLDGKRLRLRKARK